MRKRNSRKSSRSVFPAVLSVVVLGVLVYFFQQYLPQQQNLPQEVYGGGIAYKEVVVPGKIEAEDYNNGGESVAYHDVDRGNNGLQYRKDSVDIKKNPEGGYTVGWMRTGEWLEYTFEVQTAGSYKIEAFAGTIYDDNPNFTISIDGDNKGVVNVPKTANWETRTVVAGPTVVLTEGQHTLGIDINKQWLDIDYFTFTLESGESVSSTAGNVVSNPGFENGKTGWTFYTNGNGSFDINAKAARVTIQKTGSNTQLYQSGVKLKPNTRYRLQFSAYSNSGNDLALYIHKHGAPYTNYGLNNWTPNLSTSRQTFSKEFTTGNFNTTVSDARLRFWFSGRSKTGDIYFVDNITLAEVTSSPPPVNTPAPTGTTAPTSASTPTPAPPSGSGGRGPQQNPSIPGGAVYINPGQSIQAAIDANGGNTTFVLRPGTHRVTSRINPKAGNIFIGQYGAIVTGSRVFTSFGTEGSLRYINVSGMGLSADSRYPNGQDSIGLQICDSSYTRCAAQHDLFINNTPLRHVTGKSAVAPGSFYFDYGAQRVYFADNPSGKTVELLVTPQFMNSGVSNVIIKNLVVEKFASLTQQGVIHVAGSNWVVENNEFRYNHSYGVKWGNNMRLAKNYSHHNGQMGFGGIAKGMLLENNEIAYNNYARYKSNWEAGGFKLAKSIGTSYSDPGATIRGNVSHHNIGSGIWIDIDNKFIIIENNTVENNSKHGIQYEISYDGIIRNNTSRFNGSNQGFTDAVSNLSQIFVQLSSNVQVYNNNVETHSNYGSGILVFANTRGNYVSDNNDIRNNTSIINYSSAQAGAIISNKTSTYLNPNRNRFRNNTYIVSNVNGNYFRWASNNSGINFTQFKNLSGENGTIRAK